jgi:hypothetical protein
MPRLHVPDVLLPAAGEDPAAGEGLGAAGEDPVVGGRLGAEEEVPHIFEGAIPEMFVHAVATTGVGATLLRLGVADGWDSAPGPQLAKKKLVPINRPR